MQQAPQGFTTLPQKAPTVAISVRYCLYARKSTESEERQVLSIDIKIKEIIKLAERESLEIIAMKREEKAKSSNLSEVTFFVCCSAVKRHLRLYVSV
jgi:hypothetical protein